MSHPIRPAPSKYAWILRSRVASAMHQQPEGGLAPHGEIAMVEAIQDQWLILAVLAVLVGVAAWLFLGR